MLKVNGGKVLLQGLVMVLVLSLLPVVSNVSPLEYSGSSLEAANDDVKKKKKKRKRTKLPSKKAQKIFQQLQPLIEAEQWNEASILLLTTQSAIIGNI